MRPTKIESCVDELKKWTTIFEMAISQLIRIVKEHFIFGAKI